MIKNIENNKYGFTHRFSKPEDYTEIDKLLKICFGDRAKYGALDNLQNRYILVFDGPKLIAMTGIVNKEDSPFNGKEVDWTCCLPEYRKLGIITSVLTLLISNIHEDLYCSCYREPKKLYANLHNIMTNLGFKCIGYQYKTFDNRYFSACDDCNFRKDGVCVCHEDLYLKPFVWGDFND